MTNPGLPPTLSRARDAERSARMKILKAEIADMLDTIDDAIDAAAEGDTRTRRSGPRRTAA